MKRPPPEIFQQLLDDAKLGEQEVRARVGNALDPAYWRALVGGAVAAMPAAPTDPEAVAAAVADFEREGVYHLRGALGAGPIERVNRVLDAIVGAGWPGVFAFACDELWECARLEPVRALVTGALGEGALQIPHVWAHIVRGTAGGWSAHVDGPGPERMTVWIALTDAPLENGCMYAVPRSPLVAAAVEQWSDDGKVMDKEKLKHLLRATRAMPARAGDLLGWAFDIVHWGGPLDRAAPGRRSLSLEFIGARAKPLPADEPLVPLVGALPPHAARLRSIAAAILEYRKFEPLAVRFKEVAQRLEDAVDSNST